MSSQFHLLSQRRFLPLFITQFLGALNDNVLKNALVILIAFHGSRLTRIAPELMVNLCAGLFILPFFLFSASAGQLADKHEKSRLIRFVKLFEIGIMGFAAVGFCLPSLPCLLLALFLMGMHSTLFGPLKYSILPQHLREDEMIGGNGLIESGTFLAILLGTILGGSLVAIDADAGGGPQWAALACLLIAVLGYLASRAVPPAPAPDPALRIDWNPLRETWNSLVGLKHNRTVFLSILGISWFWFYGAIFLSQFPAFARNHLGGGESVVTLLLALFSVGIGFGSLLCEKLSRHKVEPGLVPLGSIGLTLFAVDLWLASPSAGALELGIADFLARAGSLRVIADLVLIGVFGGFYCVPLYTLMQTRSELTHRSRVIAANNIMNAAFMVVAALLAVVLLGAGCSIPQLFLITALINALVALYIYRLVPEFIDRFVGWIVRKGQP